MDKNRICKKCGVEKLLNQFYKHKIEKDGISRRCKICINEIIKNYYRNTKDSKERKRWYHTSYLNRKSDPAKRLKMDCRDKTRRAVIAGKITRGLCEVCKSKKVHAHHEDYTKPLDVRWLCRKHHDELHRLEGEGE